MTDLLTQLQLLVAGIRSDFPEAEVTVQIVSLDNPGWQLTLDARDIGLLPSHVEHVSIDDAQGWLYVRADEHKIIVAGGSADLHRVIERGVSFLHQAVQAASAQDSTSDVP